MTLYNKYVLNESGYRNINDIIRPFVNKEDGKVPEAEIYFHQDLDGIASALAMREYLKEYGITTTNAQIVQYGGREFYAQKPSDNKLHVLVDFGHDKPEFHIWTDHHLHDEQESIKAIQNKYGENPTPEEQKQMQQEIANLNVSGRGDVRETKSNADIINGFFSSNRGFSQQDMEIINMVDSAGFAKHNIEPEQVAKTVFRLNKELQDGNDLSTIKKHMRLASAEALLAYKNKKGFMEGIVVGENAIQPSLISLYNYIQQWIKRDNINIRQTIDDTKEQSKQKADIKTQQLEDLNYLQSLNGDFGDIDDKTLEYYKQMYNTDNVPAIYTLLQIKYKMTKEQGKTLLYLIDKLKHSGITPENLTYKTKGGKDKQTFTSDEINIIETLSSVIDVVANNLLESDVNFTDDEGKKLKSLLKKFTKELPSKEIETMFSLVNQDLQKSDRLADIKKRYLQRSLDDVEKNKMDYAFEMMFSNNIRLENDNVIFSNGLAEMQANKVAVTYGGYNRYSIFRTYRNASYAIVEWGMGLLQISCNPWKDKKNPINLYDLTNKAIEKVKPDLKTVTISLNSLKKMKENNPKDKENNTEILGFKSGDIKTFLENGQVTDREGKPVTNERTKKKIEEALNRNRHSRLSGKETDILKQYIINAYDWIKGNSGGHNNISNIAGLDIVSEYKELDIPDVPEKPNKNYIASYEQKRRAEKEDKDKADWTDEQKEYEERRQNFKQKKYDEMNPDMKKVQDTIDNKKNIMKHIDDYNYDDRQQSIWVQDNLKSLVGYGKGKLMNIFIGDKIINYSNVDSGHLTNKWTTLETYLRDLQQQIIANDGEMFGITLKDLNNLRIGIRTKTGITIKSWQVRLQHNKGKFEKFDTIESVMLRKYASNSYSYKTADNKRNITKKIKDFLYDAVKDIKLVSPELQQENGQKEIRDRADHLIVVYNRIKELNEKLKNDPDLAELKDTNEVDGFIAPKKRLENYHDLFMKQVLYLQDNSDKAQQILDIVKNEDGEVYQYITSQSHVNESLYNRYMGVL